jgi:hypothetical protein
MKSKILLFALVATSYFLTAQELITDTIPGTSLTFDLKYIDGGDALEDFYIGTHEVTHDMFVLFKRKEFDSEASDLSADYKSDAITRPTPPYEDMTWGMGDEGGFPAVSMTQNGALSFCEWLYLKTGRFYRLPTPEEWTYVAKMHKDTDGWFYENSGDKYHKTGEFASETGIYDLFGNVVEWTMDRKVLKGGSFIDDAADIDADAIIPYDRKWQQRDPQIPKSIWWLTDGSFVGFRLLSPKVQPSSAEIKAFFEEHTK